MHKQIISKFAKLVGFLSILAMSLWLVAPAATAADFTGTWETVASTGNRYTMHLTQSGNTVTGTYSPQNGTIDGMVKNKVMTFSWSQAGGYTGTGTFTLSGDGNSFNGKWFSTGEQGDTQGFWTGRRK